MEGERKAIEKAIQAYGTDPEQNYGYFLSHETASEKCVYLKGGRYGILATYNPQAKNWVMNRHAYSAKKRAGPVPCRGA